MKLLEIILELLGVWKGTREKAESISQSGLVGLILANREFVFAYILVPAFAIFYWGNESNFFAQNRTAQNSIVYEAFETAIANNQTLSISGNLFMFLEPDGEYVIPWADELKDVRLSIDAQTFSNNAHNIIVRGDSLKLELPLLGTPHGISIFASGKSKGKIIVKGGEIAIEEMLSLAQLQSRSIAMWCFMATIFGFGLVFSSGIGPEANARQSGTGNHCS